MAAVDHEAIRRVRRIGMRGVTARTNFSSAMILAVMSLLIQPGGIALAVTP
jgi:hypothetical protein